MNKNMLGELMKQMKEAQEKAQEMQAKMQEMEVEGAAGGGMVKIILNGKSEVMSVTIDQEVVNPDDVEMLQDLVMGAFNQATQKIQETQAEELSNLTGGLNIPGLNLPF
ncbi:MAG: YbaB/EbfC family nucleoid-associated protein [candidate division Zixibacteria bacterium]|nr:YbaB/EbfC family nucleoid-associated protein [candidate division Zixibacteria bacterium]